MNEQHFIMAVVTILSNNQTLTDEQSIRQCLKNYGIDYERWSPEYELPEDALAEEVLDAYSKEIDKLKAQGGYVTADVINVTPETPGLDEMLAKSDREHWHDEAEVRLLTAGHCT